MPLTRFSFVFCMIFFVLVQLKIQAQPLFQHAIGMQSFEKGSSVRQLADGGFVVGGETESYGLSERDMLLMRTDSNGNVIWSQTYGGPEREVINDVVLMPDNGFMFAAEKYQPHQMEGENLTLCKTDQLGNLKWKKIYDEGGNETEGFSLQSTPDHNYVVAGMIKNLSMVSSAFFNMRAEEQSLYLLKVDAGGTSLWSRRFDYGDVNISSTGTSVIVARDGSYLVAGNVTKKGRTDRIIERPAHSVNMEESRCALLIKVNKNGQLQWAREFAAGSITMGYVVIEKKSGGFILAGNTNVTEKNVDIFVASLSANGDLEWAKTYGGPKFESVADILETPDGGIVVSGMSESLGHGSFDVIGFKVDNLGNLIWSKAYGGQNEDMPSRMASTPGGIVTVGATASNGSESYDVLLMKSDWNGNSGCMSKEITLTVGAFQPTVSRLEKSSMKKVEQGIVPPNYHKPEANNIIQNKREIHSKELCH